MNSKITSIIIALILFFSSANFSFAEEWYIERLFDLNFWIEEYKLDLAEINYINFNENKYNNIYNELKTVDAILRNEIMKNYRNWEYKYYQTNWIVKNYNNYIYHINKYFLFIKLKEQNPNLRELDSAILKSYTNLKNSYIRIKNLIKKN